MRTTRGTSWSGAPYPPLYAPFKSVSLRLVPALRDTRLSSNAVTVTWAAVLVAAAVAVGHRHTPLAFALVLVAILLDCVDGDLARIRSRPTLSGTLLEQFAHWTGNMSLMAAAGAALVLADHRPRDVLLAAVLVVVQALYIAVVRQVRPHAADIPGHPRLRAAFRVIVRVLWLASPIELPLIGTLAVLGVREGVVLAMTMVLACATTLIFVPHLMLIRAADLTSSPAGTTAARPPEADWWTPGTPRLAPEVLRLLGSQPMASGAPVVRSARRELAESLPMLFRTRGQALALACPEEVALEAALGSVCRPGDRILAVGGPAAIHRWSTAAERTGVRVTTLGEPFGAPDLAAALDGHRAVCLQLSDAERGTRTDLSALAEAARGAPPLVMVDACLGLCADDLRMDAWGVDIAVSCSDSGIMGPPGLSLIALGPRALSALDQPPVRPGGYLDLRTHLTGRPQARLPAPAVMGLNLAVRLILTADLDTVLARRASLAERLRRRCENAGLTPVAAEPTAACTCLLVPADVDPAELRDALFAEARMVVGHGTVPGGAATLHVGHTGWLSAADIDRAADALAAAVHTARH